MGQREFLECLVKASLRVGDSAQWQSSYSISKINDKVILAFLDLLGDLQGVHSLC